MAKAKKLPSGNWRAQVYDYTDTEGKRHYESFSSETKKEAEYMAAEFALNKNEKIKGNITVDAAIDNYIAIKGNVLSPSTLLGYKRYKTYFKEIKTLKLSQLNSSVIQSWVGNLSALYAPKTVHNAHGLLSAILKDNNATIPDTSLPQKIKPVCVVPCDEDVKALIEYFKESDTDMLRAVYLAAYGTLRRSEVCALDIADVTGNMVHVHQAIVFDQNGNWVTKTTKTASSDRYVEFPQFVVDSFPTSGKIVNLTPGILSDRFRKAFVTMGIKEFRFHDLRHYSASIMHAIGVPDQYIMERGGWSSDLVLKQIYRGTITDYRKHYTDMTNSYFSNLQENEMQHEMQHKKTRPL